MNVATESVEITPRGIRKVLNKYTPQRAIAEYIWNGYDAHAKEVRVNTICENIFDSIIKVIVRDDGDGIIHEQLPVVFKKFYESHKSVKEKYLEDFTWVENLCAEGKLDKAIERAENNIMALGAGKLEEQSYSYVYKVFKK